MGLFSLLVDLFYPPKCVRCGKLLEQEERDLCMECRKLPEQEVRQISKPRKAASVTAVCYYEELVRESLLRYKFRDKPCYAQAYGRLLADKIRQAEIRYDLITWVPVSARRRRRRGYDQAQLLAQATAEALGTEATATLCKHRDIPAQSGIQDAARRRANVLGVYRVLPRAAVQGKEILLIDDILTTGATLSEAIRMLLEAGAGEVHAAVFAAARKVK